MKVLVKIHQIVVTVSVEPSITVGAVLFQALVSQNMEPQPDGLQRLFLGDAPLDSLRTLADLGLEDGAELVFTGSSQQTGSALLPPQTSVVESRDGAHVATLPLQFLHVCSNTAVDCGIASASVAPSTFDHRATAPVVSALASTSTVGGIETTSSAVDAHASELSVIYSMGFEEALVRLALAESGGDEARAVEALLTGSLSAEQMAAAAVDVSDLSDARPVKMIFSMGFDEALVQRALAQAGGNEQGAIEILISGQLDPEESPSFSSSRDASLSVVFSMGFDDAMVRRALASAGGDEERAVDLLLSGRLAPSEFFAVSAPDISATAALALPSHSSAHVFARVLFDFEADHAEDELTLKVDQLIEVTHDAIQCICCIYLPAQTSTNV
jgi:hypothetical protein